MAAGMSTRRAPHAGVSAACPWCWQSSSPRASTCSSREQFRVSEATHYVYPVFLLVLVVILVVGDPGRIDRESRWLRVVTGVMVASITVVDGHLRRRAWSSASCRAHEFGDAAELLTIGAVVWVTMVISYALWYWHLDCGGPAARANGTYEERGILPAFRFPEQDLTRARLRRPGTPSSSTTWPCPSTRPLPSARQMSRPCGTGRSSGSSPSPPSPWRSSGSSLPARSTSSSTVSQEAGMVDRAAVMQAVRRPASAAVAGIIFAVILGAVIVLLRNVVPEVTSDLGQWSEDPGATRRRRTRAQPHAVRRASPSCGSSPSSARRSVRRRTVSSERCSSARA